MKVSRAPVALVALISVAICPWQTQADGGGVAVLQLNGAGARARKRRRFAARLAEWSTLAGQVDGSPVVLAKDPYGCKLQASCLGCALFVQEGGCTFAVKARRAAAAGARLLIVASATEGPVAEMADAPRTTVFTPRAPRITAVMISKASGRQLVLALGHGEVLTATVWRARGTSGDFASELAVGVLAVGIVMLGAWYSVEDIRKPSTKVHFNAEVFAVQEHSGFTFVVFGSIVLIVLYFFMKYLIYGLLVMFAAGAVSTTTMLLEPLVATRFPELRERRSYSMPKWLADMLGVPEVHKVSDAVAEGVGLVLAVAFLLYRNNATFGWMLQDTIAVMLLLAIQRTLRLANLRIAAVLLISTFFFDIFWVFISPAFFKHSVMIEVATGGGTGQSVPMVLKIPAFNRELPGQFKILGLGDVAIPGLLISLLLRHDLTKGATWGTGYFAAGVIGYAVGLFATFVSLYVMEHGQPALLFLVPGTLIPTCWIARRKGELSNMWTADYGPEKPPEGYEKLADDADKQA